jgi:hypothetical protein
LICIEPIVNRCASHTKNLTGFGLCHIFVERTYNIFRTFKIEIKIVLSLVDGK